MLRPIQPGTDRPKTLADMSATERAGMARQCYDEQFHNLRTGWPVDGAAVQAADEIVDASGDMDLQMARDGFRSFRKAKEGDVLVLREKLAEAEREAARLRKGR